MTALTKPQKFFALTGMILSATFFYFLQLQLFNKTYNAIAYCAIAYGASMFLNGLVWGYFDRVRNSRMAIGYIYHAITYVVVNGIFIAGVFFYQPMKNIRLWAILNQLIFWGVGLWVHYYYSKKTIKGMKPEEIFE